MNEHRDLPFITIVMPVYNEARFIEQTLGQLLAQDYPAERFEILVVDGMSTDETRRIVDNLSKQHRHIHLLDNPKRKSSAGRNIGFKTGKGDYFLVVDGHCFIPDNRLIANTVTAFQTSGADCLGRPQPLDPLGLSTFQQAVALARSSRLGHGGDSLIYSEFEGFASPVSNGAAYAHHVFEKVGYVDENFDACEDVEFNYRVEKAGLTCYTSPKLTVRYYPRENLRGLFRQMVRYGTGRFRFIKKHHEALTAHQLVPAAFVLGFCCFMSSFLFLLLKGATIPLILTAIPYCLYIMLIARETLNVFSKDGIRHAMMLPPILFMIHFALGYGFLQEATRSLGLILGHSVNSRRAI